MIGSLFDHRWVRVALAGSLLWAFHGLLCVSGASAQSAIAPRDAQFVFVIDDSGSMGEMGSGNTDPDRLAVFAVRALLGVLDDGDSATVVRLNASADGKPIEPLGPLDRQRREHLDQQLALTADLAAYRGGNTPCRSALQQVADELERADRRGVSQTVILLKQKSPPPRGQWRQVNFGCSR